MSAAQINHDLALDILRAMPEKKKEALRRALAINNHNTSARMLEHGSMTVYKEGWYVELNGCRCSFAVYAEDHDGEIIPMQRKTIEKKLHFLYCTTLSFDESDFDDI